MDKIKKMLVLLIVVNILTSFSIIIFKYKTEITVFIDSIINKRVVTIKEKNKYYRNYNYLTFNVSDDYNPSNDKDVKNIFFNILNNGYDSFYFYCDDKDYDTCLSDVERISNDDILMNNINNYVSPLNSYESMTNIISSNKKIEIVINKNYDEEKLNYINEEINNIIYELNIDDLTNREKVYRIHNYLISYLKYDNTLTYNRVDETLKYKTATCNGYTDLFAIILDRYNIPNFRVSSADHIWNSVYIDNEWYHIDVTWDDNDFVNNKYLFVTTDELMLFNDKDHTYDYSFYKELY